MENIEGLMTEAELNPPASTESIDTLEKYLPWVLPHDYLDFMARHNGGAGWVGENFINMYQVEELIEFNKDNEINKYAPNFFTFASDGGGEGFAFDFASSKFAIVLLPFIGMEPKAAIFLSSSFTGLFQKLATQADIFPS